MRKSILYILMIMLLVILTFVVLDNVKTVEQFDAQNVSVINIFDCTEEFMDTYFNEYEIINANDNKDNVLIVTSLEDIEETYGATNVVKAPNNQYLIQYNNEEEKENALQKLKENSEIIGVDENVICTLQDTYNSWGIETVGLNEATQKLTSYGANDVTVAIIDTGCDMDLFNEYYAGKIVDKYNVIDNDSDVSDIVGHGTHIAGTIAEGTVSNVKIIPIKVANGRSIYLSDIITAINYAITRNDVDVINMSFGVYSNQTSLYNAICAANAKNIICVAAAGNEATDKEMYPAAYDNTISVASCAEDLSKSSFSNYGKTITFTAPGSSIRSINGVKSGTSMAAPHAVNAVALLRGYNSSYTMNDVIEILKEYAIDLGDEGKDIYYGYGLINFKGITYCNCNCDKCDKIYCKDCNCKNCVFRKVIEKPDEIQLEEVATLPYNYGSITNLANTKLKIYTTDDTYEIKTLNELEDVVIEGYDPYSYVSQNITIKYKDYELKFDLKQDKKELGWEYIVDNDTVEITKYKPISNFTLKTMYIPEKINGKTVVKLGDGLFTNKNINNFILPDSVVKIGNSVFMNSSLETIDIKADVISVGKFAFYGVQKLKNINAKIESVGIHSFDRCSNLANVELADGIKEISEFAFANCLKLEKIAFKNSIETIGDYAFYNCSSLKNAIIQENTTSIGINAFADCTKLEKVLIPSTVNTIGKRAFMNDISINQLIVDDNNEKYYSLEDISILEKENDRLISAPNGYVPCGTKIIGESAFEDSSRLGIVIIPYGVTEIESRAFANCINIDTVAIPNTVSKISSNAFYGYDAYITCLEETYADKYAVKNNIKHNSIIVEVDGIKDTYKAFETVDTDKIVVTMYNSDRTEIETIDQSFEVRYENQNDSFRYGETKINLYGPSFIYFNFDIDVPVQVVKAVPEYEIPTDINAVEGQALSDIKLPEGFEWTDTSIVLNKLGNNEYNAKFVPEDTENYEIVENIKVPVHVDKKIEIINRPEEIESEYVYNGEEQEFKLTGFDNANMTISGNYRTNAGEQTVTVSLKNEYTVWDDNTTDDLTFNFKIEKADINASYEAKDSNVLYDGKAHGASIRVISPDEVIVKYMDENGDYVLDSAPKYTEIGEHAVYYMFYINENYNKVYGEQTIRINEVPDDIQIADSYLIIKNFDNSYINLCKKLNTNGMDTEYVHCDKEQSIIDDDIIRTGDFIEFKNEEETIYELVVLGDINCDGSIDEDDYALIKSYIMNNAKFDGTINEIAADVNEDNQITAMDYMIIKKYVKSPSVYNNGKIDVSPISISLKKGEESSFTIFAESVCGKIEILVDDSSIVSVNERTEWIDNNTITVNLIALESGTTDIIIKPIDIATYNEEDLSGNYSVNIDVEEPEENKEPEDITDPVDDNNEDENDNNDNNDTPEDTTDPVDDNKENVDDNNNDMPEDTTNPIDDNKDENDTNNNDDKQENNDNKEPDKIGGKVGNGDSDMIDKIKDPEIPVNPDKKNESENKQENKSEESTNKPEESKNNVDNSKENNTNTSKQENNTPIQNNNSSAKQEAVVEKNDKPVSKDGKSTNNLLKKISIEGYTLVKRDGSHYFVEVEKKVEKVTIEAEAEDSKAVIEGLGEKKLYYGDNRFEIFVTSESGTKTSYFVTVKRKTLDDASEVSSIKGETDNNAGGISSSSSNNGSSLSVKAADSIVTEHVEKIDASETVDALSKKKADSTTFKTIAIVMVVLIITFVVTYDIIEIKRKKDSKIEA